MPRANCTAAQFSSIGGLSKSLNVKYSFLRLVVFMASNILAKYDAMIVTYDYSLNTVC